MFTGLEVTDKGIAMMADYVARVREIAGMEIPIATDHFGHMGVNACIRLGKAVGPRVAPMQSQLRQQIAQGRPQPTLAKVHSPPAAIRAVEQERERIRALAARDRSPDGRRPPR
jgi:hypothetical protein